MKLLGVLRRGAAQPPEDPRVSSHRCASVPSCGPRIPAAPSPSLLKIVNPPATPALAATGRFLWIRRNRRAKWMPPRSERTRALAVRTTHFFNSSLSTPDPVPARESSKHPHERHRTQHHESASKMSHGGNFKHPAQRSKQIGHTRQPTILNCASKIKPATC